MDRRTGGVRIRLATADDASDIAAVNVQAWQNAYRGILPDSFLDALDVSSRAERVHEALTTPAEGRFTCVAEIAAAAGGLHPRIAGFASNGPGRDGLVAGGVAYDSEIYALYVAPERQRQGIGRRLVEASAARLIAGGARSIAIWTLKDNRPARAFYEALGGTLAGEKYITIGPSDLVEVAYGWPDANVLLRQAGRVG